MHYVKTKNANLGVRRFTLSLAESEGFEPSRAFLRLHP